MESDKLIFFRVKSQFPSNFCFLHCSCLLHYCAPLSSYRSDHWGGFSISRSVCTYSSWRHPVSSPSSRSSTDPFRAAPARCTSPPRRWPRVARFSRSHWAPARSTRRTGSARATLSSPSVASTRTTPTPSSTGLKSCSAT